MQELLNFFGQGAYPIIMVLGVGGWRLWSVLRRRRRLKHYLARHAQTPSPQDAIERWLIATAGAIWFAGQPTVVAQLKPSMKVANLHHVGTKGPVEDSLHWQEFLSVMQNQLRLVIADDDVDATRTLGDWASYLRDRGIAEDALL